MVPLAVHHPGLHRRERRRGERARGDRDREVLVGGGRATSRATRWSVTARAKSASTPRRWPTIRPWSSCSTRSVAICVICEIASMSCGNAKIAACTDSMSGSSAGRDAQGRPEPVQPGVVVGEQQVVLGREVPVEGAHRDAGVRGDLLDRGRLDALAHEPGQRGPAQRGAGPRRCGPSAPRVAMRGTVPDAVTDPVLSLLTKLGRGPETRDVIALVVHLRARGRLRSGSCCGSTRWPRARGRRRPGAVACSRRRTSSSAWPSIALGYWFNYQFVQEYRPDSGGNAITGPGSWMDFTAQDLREPGRRRRRARTTSGSTW